VNESVNRCDHQAQVVGLGQACLDIIGLIPTFPLPDEKCEISDMTVQGGGPVATALVTLSRLGVATALIGFVGDDWCGPLIRQGLDSEGVDTEHLRVLKGGNSQAAFIAVNPHAGDRTIFWRRGSGTESALEEEEQRVIQLGRFLHLDGLRLDASLAAADTARQARIPVMLDAGTMREGYLELISLTDYLICSETFFRTFQPDGDFARGLEKLMALGPRQVVVTLGVRGSRGFDGQRIHVQPAFPVKAVDTTGAGDVYHGAYIFSLLNGWSMVECMLFASATAAIKCTETGGRTGIPSLEQVMGFLGEDVI
jgi:sulfofructose kinase